MKKMMILAAVALFAFACDNDDDTLDDIIDPKVYIYDFDDGTEGWNGGYADYPADGEDVLGLNFESSELPEPLDVDEGALMISGTGGGENLFLYTKKKITDLEPNTTYQVSFKVKLAATIDTAGIDTNNDAALYIKAGVALSEPVTEPDNAGYNRFTGIDKGQVGQNGADAIVLAGITDETNWDDLTLETVSNNENPLQITTDANGEAWAFVGTETVAGNVTTVFYDSIEVDFD